MPKWISAAFALFLSLQVFSTRGESVDDVINSYVKATGGRDMRSELDCICPLINYKLKGSIAELTGIQNVHGTSCFSVKLTLKSGLVIYYLIDAENRHIVREIRKGYIPGNGTNSNSDMIIDNIDYRKTGDSYLFPFKVLYGEYPKTVLNYQKIEMNKPVNSGLYKAGN